MKFLIETLAFSLAFQSFAYAIECQARNDEVFDCTYGCCGSAKDGVCCSSTDLVIIVVPVLFGATILIIGGLAVLKCLLKKNSVAPSKRNDGDTVRPFEHE